MSLVKWKLDYERYNGSGYDSPVELQDYHDVKLTLALGSSKDSFSFVVSNDSGDYDDYFHPNDIITISRKLDDFSGSLSWSNSDVIMRGAIRDAQLTHSYNKKEIRVSGYNFSETLMNALTFVDATNLTIVQALKDSLTNVGYFNHNFEVTWSSTNPSVKYTDGSSFPICNERFFNKPISYILEKYSKSTATQDGNYYYFVNSSNELIWDKRRSNTTGSFSSSTDDYSELVIKRDLKDVKNFVVVKGGLDAKNRIIQDKAADYASIAKNGFKFYILVDEAKTARSILEQDLAAAGVDNMADASYPFTPYWSNGTSYSSFDDYNDAFRLYVREILRNIGKDYIDLYKYGKYELLIKKKPDSNYWGLGDVIACDVPQLASGTKLMRVEGIDYSTSTDQYTLKEDVGSIGSA